MPHVAHVRLWQLCTSRARSHVYSVHHHASFASQLYAAALRLDGPTLANLELLENNTGESAGSLLSCLDTCACAGGDLTICAFGR